MLLLIDLTDIMITRLFLFAIFLNYYNTIDYDVAPDLCIGYQYLSLGSIQISPLVIRNAPIMFENLLIIPSSTSQNLYLLFFTISPIILKLFCLIANTHEYS